MEHQGLSARTLPRLDMASLHANLPTTSAAGAGSAPSSYNSLERPRPSFSSSSGATPSSSSSNPHPDLSSAFSPWSPTVPAVPAKYTLSDGPRPGMTEQYSDADASHHAPQLDSWRPLPTPPPITSPVSATGKRVNPLEDLILTETLYVADLGAIIKRVAGAWSRSNFPPPALDTMFRAVEAVYRINKGLLAKLNEIGPNPASPKALGDLLMQWPIDLSPAYSRYSTTYQVDFDRFDAVQSNEKLGPILAGLDWPGTLARPASPSPPTLDQLFQLPLVRLGYYKKLYTKLLKSTQEGRSDHALLVNANEQIDRLICRCEEAKGRSVVLENGGTLPLTPSASFKLPRLPVQDSLSEPVSAETASSPIGMALSGPASNDRSSGESARVEDSSSSSLRSSAATGTTNNTSAAAHLASSYTTPPRIDELERRLSTDRVLDIFTMLPKKCKLQMAPPNLPFARQIRRAADVSISFTPLSDPSQQLITIPNAYILLLTDLFLVCEHMTPEERAHSGDADMWLLYPPLAGKHLRVVDGQVAGELEVTIMRKEKLYIRTEDAATAREWRMAFDEAVEFGAQQPSLRSNSVSSRGPISPISPPSNAPLPLHSYGAPSPSSYDAPRSAGYSNGHSVNSESQSPHYDSPQEMHPPAARGSFGNGLPSVPNQHYGGDRRAFSAGPAPPPRGASMYGSQQGYQSTASLSSGPSSSLPRSPNYDHQDFGRVSSPSNGQPPFIAPPNGRQSPYGQQLNHYPSNSDFGALSPPPNLSQSYGTHPGRQPQNAQQYQQQYEYAPPLMQGARPQRTNSGRSNGSYTSGRTDHSSAYPEPPPLPGKPGTLDRFGAHTPGSNESHGAGGRRTGASSRTGSGLLSPGGSMYRSQSAEGLRDVHQYRMPSAALQEDRANSAPGSSYGGAGGRAAGRFGDDDDSPPPSPMDKVPEQTVVVAQMRSKIFLRQNLGQWKSLGTGKLKLFLSQPSNTKQLVVDSDKGNPPKTVISTIVLTDGVERVGKTGVAVELSDNGSRTGIVYMLQMKTEQAATGLFDQLLLGSDRKRLTR